MLDQAQHGVDKSPLHTRGRPAASIISPVERDVFGALKSTQPARNAPAAVRANPALS